MKEVHRYYPKSEYTNPGLSMGKIRAICVHWIGNAGTNAEQNMLYQQSQDDVKNPRHGSYHAIVDLDGTIYNTVRPGSVAWHCGPAGKTRQHVRALCDGADPNYRVLGISFCHELKDGTVSTEQLDAACKWIAKQCKRYKLNPFWQVLNHGMVVPTSCPGPYLSSAEGWTTLLKKVSYELGEE